MNINDTLGKVCTFKLNSGEEMIARVELIEYNFITVSEPVSVAPGPQGLVPSVFTAERKGSVTLNINNVAIYALTDEEVKMKYIEATTGIKVPEKKLILG
jgi:hypothetical protein